MYIDALKAIHKPDPVLLCNLAASFLKQEMYDHDPISCASLIALQVPRGRTNCHRSAGKGPEVGEGTLQTQHGSEGHEEISRRGDRCATLSLGIDAHLTKLLRP